MTARGLFAPFTFLLPLHHSRLLLRPGRLGLPLLPRRRLPPPGTAVLVTLAATFWLSSVVVPLFLVLGLLLTSPVLSLSGYKYCLVVVDDFSHYSWTFPLRAKSETFPTLLH